jgi:hypothetical protein
MTRPTQPPGILTNIRRYGRAFLLALRFTLRGEKPPLLNARERAPNFAAWLDRTVALTTALESAARDLGIDSAQVVIRADRRDVSMATIVGAIRFHAEREYPYLMVQHDEYAPLTVQATNLNDRYLLMQLAGSVDARLKASIDALSEHLSMLPVDN